MIAGKASVSPNTKASDVIGADLLATMGGQVWESARLIFSIKQKLYELVELNVNANVPTKRHDTAPAILAGSKRNLDDLRRIQSMLKGYLSKVQQSTVNQKQKILNDQKLPIEIVNKRSVSTPIKIQSHENLVENAMKKKQNLPKIEVGPTQQPFSLNFKQHKSQLIKGIYESVEVDEKGGSQKGQVQNGELAQMSILSRKSKQSQREEDRQLDKSKQTKRSSMRNIQMRNIQCLKLVQQIKSDLEQNRSMMAL